MLVLVCHAEMDCGSASSSGAEGVYYHLLHVGWCGVDLFFVLSGFLITGVLLDARGQAHFFRNFYARRTLRIFPLYYGILGGLALLTVLWPGSPLWAGFARDQGWYWSYCQNWMVALYHRPAMGSLSHFWSLAIEEQFYAFWPLLVFLAAGRGLVRLCVALAVLSLLARCVMTACHASTDAVFMATFTRLDGLSLGAMVCVLGRQVDGRAWLSRVCRPAAVACACGLAGLFVIRNGMSEYDWVFQTAGYTLLAVMFAATVGAIVGRPQGFVGRVMAWRPLRLLGKISYGVYVFHLPINAAMIRLWRPEWKRHGVLNPLLFLAVSMAAAVTVATLSWLLYERHFLRLKERFSSRKKMAPAANIPAEQATFAGKP